MATALLLSGDRRLMSCEKASSNCRLTTSGTASESTACASIPALWRGTAASPGTLYSHTSARSTAAMRGHFAEEAQVAYYSTACAAPRQEVQLRLSYLQGKS